MEPYRIVLADEHILFRQGIRRIIDELPETQVVGEASDGQEAIELAGTLRPDVILMDVSMPKLSGVEATHSIHNAWPQIHIIGLSMFEETDRARAMRAAGAVEYLTKTL